MATEQTEKVETALILSTEPNSIPEGQQLVYFTRKDTKKNPVADADKFRGIILPSYQLPVAYSDVEGTEEMTAAADVFQAAIKEAFLDAAGTILRTFVESNKDAKEVPVSLFTFENVVAQMQATVTKQRLNSEMIAAWYDASATATDAKERYKGDEKKMQALRAHYLSLASNNPGINPALATKMIGYVNPADVTNSTCATVLERLDVQAKKDTSDDL